MANRNDIYKQFGPMLLEAQMLVLLEQINQLRKEHSMPEITEQDLLNSLNNRLPELELYPFLQEGT